MTTPISEIADGSPCAQCRSPSVVTNLDGFPLCLECADNWFQDEGMFAPTPPPLGLSMKEYLEKGVR